MTFRLAPEWDQSIYPKNIVTYMHPRWVYPYDCNRCACLRYDVRTGRYYCRSEIMYGVSYPNNYCLQNYQELDKKEFRSMSNNYLGTRIS